MSELWGDDKFRNNEFWIYLEDDPFKGTAKYSKMSVGETPLPNEGFWVINTQVEVQSYELDSQDLLAVASPVVELRKGWNIVGVEKSLPIKLTEIEFWEWYSLLQDYQQHEQETNLVPTKGYWIFMMESGFYLQEDSTGEFYKICAETDTILP